MAKPEYAHNLPITENRKYKSIDVCDFCSHHHVGRHRSPSQLFNCESSNPEPYRCKSCGKNFDTVTHLRNHITETHSDTERLKAHTSSYACRTCSFVTCSALRSLKHTRNGCLKIEKKTLPKHNCDKCEYKTKWKQDLSRHQMAKHCESKRWFKCEKCAFKTVRKDRLSKHVLSIHSESGVSNCFQCKKCSYKSSWESFLASHAQLSDGEGKKWFHCDKCTYKTKWKGDLRKHIRAKHSHCDNKQWFKCEHCSYEVKWSECEKCSYKTTSKRDMNIHVITKHNDKIEFRFQCDKCTFKTMWKGSFTTHVKAKHTEHEDKIWFKCERCPYRSVHKGHLKRHCLTKH